MERRQYRNPPIEEAICELRFAPAPQTEFTAPARFYESIKSAYPGSPRYQQLMSAGFQLAPQPAGAQVAMRQESVKIIFPSSDERHLVGLGQNTLSVHALKPYSGWDEEFRPRIEGAIKAYESAEAPVGVTRIGMRYVNRIQVKSEGANAHEYIKIAPRMPDGLPVTLRNFVTRLESAYGDQEPQLLVTIANAEPSPPAVSAWLLDVDVIQEWSRQPLPMSALMDCIDKLRELEREAFEAFITDRSREAFDVE